MASPDDDAVVVSPCEATPYRIASRVHRLDEFWAKAEPYSVEELLAGDETADLFVDGTVWQAFLSALEYHRWHSPGRTVLRAWVEPGTYYSEASSQGADAAEPQLSQGYLAHVATRAILLIDADDPTIGTIAVVFVGMSDVSSCVIGEGIEAGTRVGKGDELGYFQFGGSSVCVLFGPDVVESFSSGRCRRRRRRSRRCCPCGRTWRRHGGGPWLSPLREPGGRTAPGGHRLDQRARGPAYNGQHDARGSGDRWFGRTRGGRPSANSRPGGGTSPSSPVDVTVSTPRVAEVEAVGRRGLALIADVADRQAVEAAADRTEQELGPIDLWVNCVMVGVFGRFTDTGPTTSSAPSTSTSSAS